MTWPWIVSEAGGVLALIQTSLLFICRTVCLFVCRLVYGFYIGDTKRRKDRLNEHRRQVDKKVTSSKPTTVSKHFLSNDHNASGMLLIPLELIKSNRDSVRKAREAYLIDRGQTIESLGLNRRDET